MNCKIADRGVIRRIEENRSESIWIFKLYFLAVIAGLITGTIAWFIASHWIASSITSVEDRRPELVGSKRLRVGEAVACGALFLACFAIAFWIVRFLWLQIK